MSDEKVTLGEVYRLCQRIESKVDRTNGRVTTLEKDAVRIKAIGGIALLAVPFARDWIKQRLGLS